MNSEKVGNFRSKSEMFYDITNQEGGDFVKKWFDEYKQLDLMDGMISFILEDDEDMIEILYKDGLLIDVGYIDKLSSYFITVVSNNDWINPIEEIKVEHKKDLLDRIQKTIYKYRSK